MAQILVHLDTRDGLVEAYNLHFNDMVRVQILDYEGVPFRCRRCHEVGHLYKECPLIITTSAPSKALVHAGTQTDRGGEEKRAQESESIDLGLGTFVGGISVTKSHLKAQRSIVHPLVEDIAHIPSIPRLTPFEYFLYALLCFPFIVRYLPFY